MITQTLSCKEKIAVKPLSSRSGQVALLARKLVCPKQADIEITQRGMETLGLQARSALWAVSGHNILYNAFIGNCDPSFGGVQNPCEKHGRMFSEILREESCSTL